MSERQLETLGAPSLELTSFSLAGEEYALDIAAVQEIVRMTPVTHMPGAPEFLEGVVNLRGRIVPVVDLRRRFGLPAAEATKSTRIIIALVAGQTVGLIVDSVNQVLRMEALAVSPPPDLMIRHGQAEFVRGVGRLDDRLVLLLDLSRLLSEEEVGQIPAA